MKRSELINNLAEQNEDFSASDIEAMVAHLIEMICQALEEGRRVEVRGFGSLSLRQRRSRLGRNPKTGESVALPVRYVPHFKPGKTLRERVDSLS